MWRNCQNFMVLQDALYLHSIPKGENEDLLLFMVLKEHQTATLNGCHQDAGHQGCDCTLSLLQECSGARDDKTDEISYEDLHTLHSYEDGIPKASLCPIVATAPLDLLHVDFISIETTLELNQSP